MFKHIKSSCIEKSTVEFVAKYNNLNNRREEIEMERDGSASSSSIDTIDGIPVHPETRRFCEQLRKQHRGCTFGVDDECKTTWFRSRLVHNDVWFMLPGQVFALARVGFGDYSSGKSNVCTYIVQSRNIKNAKYRDTSDQYNMAMSTDLDRALKNAKKHIRLYQTHEIARQTAREFTKHVERDHSKAYDNISSACNKIRDSRDLYQELKHLVDCGHKFLSAEFAGYVANWIDKSKAWDAERLRTVPAYFVHVEVLRDEQIFNVLDIEDAKGKLGNYVTDLKDAEAKRYKADDIPEDIMGKLSVLSLLESGGYSAGVGKRVDETVFWVER